MRKDAFNSRRPRNVIRSSSRVDQFNASFKKERHDDPPQFPTSEIEEVRRFSETRDTRKSCSQSTSRGSSSRSPENRSHKGRSSGKAARNATNTLVRQAIVMVAGAVVVTNTYTAAVEERDAERANALSAVAAVAELADQAFGNGDGELGVAFWTWSADHSSASVLVPGVGQAEATVSVTEESAGCVTEGTRTYTATAVIKDTTYTDTVTETIPAAGHSFGAAQITTDADGNTTLTYHCDGCDQDFEIGFTAEEAEE